MMNLFFRIASALVLAPLAVLTIFFAPIWLASTVVGIISARIGYEYTSVAFSKSHKAQRLAVSFSSAATALCLTFFNSFPYLAIVPFALIPILSYVSFMFSSSEFKSSVNFFAHSTAASIYAGGLIGLMGLTLTSFEGASRNWVFLLVTGAFIGDTTAYGFGRLFGKRKLAPRISPAKTWMGAFGGLLGTAASVAAVKIFLITDMSWLDVAVLSPLLSLFCQLGDLAESFFKRGIGVKDSSTLIPGHGGLLDRCDGLMFGAPVVYFFALFR